MKKEIRSLYLKLTNKQHYTRHNIEQLVNVQSKKEMTLQTDFGHYCQEFQVQAQYLKEQNKMTDCEVNYEFWREITGELRTDLMQWLEILYVNQDADDLFKFANVVRQADCILAAGTIHSGAVQTVTKEQEKLVIKQESKYIKVLRKLEQLQA